MKDGEREQRAAYLPTGYYLDETDRDLVVLRRRDGSEVAAYNATDTNPAEVERRAWRDGQMRGELPQATASIVRHLLVGGDAAEIGPLRTAFPHSHPLAGVGAKLQRAREHLVELNAEIAGFLAREPYAVSGFRGSKNTEYGFSIHVQETPPLRWSAIAGDCLQDMRSALEYLAWELARHNLGREPPGDTSFPIYLEPELFYSEKDGKPRRGSGLLKIRALDWEAQAEIEAVQPFCHTEGVSPGVVPHDGREGWKRIWRLDALWILNELARFDRHRALRLVVALDRSTGYSVGGRGGPIPNVKEVDLKRGPYEDSQVIGRFVFEYTPIVFGEPNPRLELDMNPSVFIGFGEEDAPTGWSVINVLGMILGRIDGEVVPRLARIFDA